MSLNFLRNRRRPQIFNPREQASRLQVSQLEADEILSVVSQSQQFQQASTNNNPPADMATRNYVDTKTNQLKNEILNGASGAYDTLKELQTELESNDSAISAITNTLSNKVNTSDLTTNYYNKTESDARYATPSQITTLQGQIDTNTSNISTNTSNISTNTSNISSLTTSVNNLNTRTNSLSVNPDTGRLTINSRLSITGGANGSITIGDNSNDTTTITGNLNLQNAVLSLNNNQISQASINNLTNDLNNKANISQTLYSNTWYINAGVNLLSSVLNSIGSSQSQCILISAGQINEPSPVSITQTNLTIAGVDSAFASPSTLINNQITLSGSMTRCRISNIGFIENFIIDGTQGRHTFKGVVFQKNMTLLNSTTNFINFFYCSFSGQVNIPNTFAGYIVFYFCDFSGATLNFNNLSNQQIYINSCINLPSLSLNASLNGYNTSVSSSSINSVSLSVSGATNFQNGSISQSSINGLTTDLNAKLNISDASNTYATISNLSTTNSNLTTTNNNVSALTTRVGTNETDISNLQQKTNVLNYDNASDTLTINSKLSVVKDSSTNNGIINLGDGIGSDVINIRSNISSNSQTITPTHLGFISGLTSNAQSQISNRVTLNTSQTISAQKNFTGGLLLNGVNLSDTISDIQTKNSSQDASISSINTSINNLENNKANVTYVDQQISNIFNNPDVNMNSITELVNALNSDSNYATTISNALSLKANDNEVVKLSGNQEISGTKNFTGAIQLSGTNLNTRINAIETKNSEQDTSISTINNNISDLQQKTNNITYNASTDTLSISSKVEIQKDLSNVASVFLGDNSGGDTIFLRGNLNVLGTTSITPTEISRLQNVSSNIQTQLNARVGLTGAQTISGLKNFTASGGLQINGTNITSLLDAKQNTLTFDNTPTENSNNSLTSGIIFTALSSKQNTLTFDTTPTNLSSNPITSGGVFTALSSKQNTLTFDTTPTNLSSNPITSGGVFTALSSKQNTLTFDTTPTNLSSNPITSGGVFTALASKQNNLTFDTTPTNSSSNPITSGGVFTALASKQNTLTFDTTPTNSSSNPITSGGVFTALSSYLTTSTASSTYVGLTSNNTISGNNSISGRNTFSNMNTFNRVCESVHQAGSGANLTLDFNNLTGGIIFYAPSSNFTLSLNNIPTTNTNCIYTLTFRYSTRFYATAINVNSAPITMTAIGGLSNLTINPSASFVYQQITIIFNNSSTPSVSTGLLSLW